MRPSSTLNLSNTIHWLPGQAFVVQVLDLPQELADEELLSTVELAVESASPLPIEHLAWGWYPDESARQILVYMSTRERCLDALQEFDTAAHVYPAFLSLINAPSVEATCRIILTAVDLSAAYFQTGARLPDAIKSIRHTEALPDQFNQTEISEAQLQIIRASFEKLQTAATKAGLPKLESNLYYLAESAIELDHSIQITLARIDLASGTCETLPAQWIRGHNVYHADLRDQAFLDNRRREDRIADGLWTALMTSAYTAAGILLLFLINWIGIFIIRHTESTIDAQAPAVHRVEEKESLLAGIELFSTSALQPFKALEIMNAERPDSVYFQNMRAGAERENAQENFFLRLKGIASSAAEADNFANRIRGNALFSTVELSDLRSQNNRTDFNLFVRIPANASESIENGGTP